MYTVGSAVDPVEASTEGSEAGPKHGSVVGSVFTFPILSTRTLSDGNADGPWMELRIEIQMELNMCILYL